MFIIRNRFLKILTYLILAGPISAQPALPGINEIDQKLETLSKRENAGELLETWKNIRTQVENARNSKKKTDLFLSEIENAPGIIEQKTNILAKTPTKVSIPLENSPDLKSIESRLTEATAELKAARTKLAAYPVEEQIRSEREKLLPGLLAKARAELAASNLPPPPAGNSTNDLPEAQYLLALAKHEALTRKVAEFDAELRSYAAQNELYIANKQITAREVARLEKVTAQWQKIFEEKNNEVSAAMQARASDQAEKFKKIPQLASLAGENARLAALSSSLNEKTIELKGLESEVIAQRTKTRNQRLGAQERIKLLESAGLGIDTKTGSLLRLQRSRLPEPRSLRNQFQKNVRESTTARIERIEIEENLENLSLDIDGQIEELLPQLTDQKIKPGEARKLFAEHRELLNSVENDYSSYITALESTNEETKKTIKEIETYTLYLDERLLWIPSASPLAISDLEVELEAIQRLLSPEELPDWFQNLFEDMGNHPMLWILTFLLLLALVYLRKNFIENLRAAGSVAERKSCQSIAPTLKSLGITFLLVLPIPLLVGFVAWRGHSPVEISKGLGECAKFLAIVGAAKTLSRPRGILTTHLGVRKKIAAHLSKHLRWFYFAMPVFLFLLQALYETPKAPQSGRLVFLVLLVVGGVFAHCLLRPSKGVIESRKNKSHLPRIVYGLALTTILAFIVGVSLGYISSVKTLRIQTLNSVGIILASLLMVKVLLRYILVSRRRLARNQAVAKYKAVVAAREKDEEAENTKHIPTLEEIEAEAINVVAVQEQTTRLVRVGMIVFVFVALWNIWSTSFPALSALDKIPLWEGSSSVPAKTENVASDLTNTLTGKESSQAQPEDPVETPEANIISLQDFLYACLVIGLTLIGARNLPGLLELSVLGRLNLKPGGNYAISTVTKYLIIAVGFVMAFGVIGITWSSVQWLAAAVTLGIGFGLQEIFANFVAGIILLFERPIRLGDVVTVGDVSGRVSEIKIRATTIRQFNNRELVVPNKEFITGQLVNWTLSDNILRFEFQVGIAYGSDTEKATKILYEILDEHPDVLKSHPPVILFKAFGNSTLDFEIRAFVTKYERFPEVQSQLHYQIDKRFREAGIEIAFPQTDIHIRSMPEVVKDKEQA